MISTRSACPLPFLACALLFRVAPDLAAGEPDKLPEPVAKTLAEQFNGATIQKVKKKTKDRAEVYEFKLTDELNKDKDYKVVLASDGRILEEDEHRIGEGQVPKAVLVGYQAWWNQAYARKKYEVWSVRQKEGKSREYRYETEVFWWAMFGEKKFYKASFQEHGALIKGDDVPQDTAKAKDAAAGNVGPAPNPVTAEAAPKAIGEPEPLKTEELDPDVVTKIRKLMRATLKVDEAEREKAWKEIREMGNLAVPGLVAVYRLPETTPEMTRSILIGLGDSKDPRAGPALLEILGSRDPGVRRDAARAIGDSRYKPGAKALRKIVSDKGEPEETRLFAAVAAVKLGAAGGSESLKEFLQSKSPEVRARAVFALGKWGGPAQLGAVSGALHDPDAGVRADAVEGLRAIGGKEACGALIEAAKDEDYKIRGAAMDALRDLTGKKFGNEPKEWQDWWAKESGGKAKEPEKKPETKDPPSKHKVTVLNPDGSTEEVDQDEAKRRKEEAKRKAEEERLNPIK